MGQKTLRLASEQDINRIAQIEKNSFSDPWTKQGFLEALHSPYVCFTVCEVEKEVAGYALLYMAADEGEIPSIAVDEVYRKQGIGSELLQELFAAAKSKNVQHIYLEVRETNEPAKKLYEKQGFCPMGIRKHFYQDPIEDAIVMCKTIEGV